MTYVGYIKKLPTKNSFGIIVSDQVPGMHVFFDKAAHTRTTGPGANLIGSHIRFEIGGTGRAVRIQRTGVRDKESEVFRHEYVREPPTG